MTTLSSADGDGLEGNSTQRGMATPPYTSYPEYQAQLVLWKIAPPCIFLLGGFGNIATVCVMRRIKGQNSAQQAVLTSLAVSDLLLLCSAVPIGWLRHVVRVEVQGLHVALCKALEWIVYSSNTASAWLVTLLTLQRAVAVLWPHRARVVCTGRRTKAAILTLVLSACGLNCHLLFGMGIVQGYGCFPLPGPYRHFLLAVFSWVDLCASSLGPSVCMFVGNIALSITLFRAASSSSAMAASVPSVVPSGVPSGVPSSLRSAGSADSRSRVSHRTTVTVLAVSCAFLVLTLPQCAYLLWLSFSGTQARRHPRSLATAVLLRSVSLQLWYSNSAVNFALYCLTGTRFRAEFLSWVTCRPHSASSAPSVTVTASAAGRGERHKAS